MKALLKVGIVLLLLLFAMLFQQSASASPNHIDLSGPLSPHSGAGYAGVSPNGNYALFLADFVQDGATELYSVPVDGSEEPTLLSNGLATQQTTIHSIKVTPNNRFVLFIANSDSNDQYELFSVPIYGGEIMKLNAPFLHPNGQVGSDYQIAPDSSHVVFTMDWQDGSIDELFSTPIRGNVSTRLNDDLVMNGIVSSFDITPDGSEVIYTAYQDMLAAELYRVPTAGGATSKLNEPLVAGGGVRSFRVSPDGARVVYVADQEIDDKYELYAKELAPMAGAAIKLNQPLGVNGDVGYRNFAISPDSSHVVFNADPSFDNVFRLFTVPIAGGAPILLNELGTGSMNDNGYELFQISSDSSYVVYQSRFGLGTHRRLYSVPLLGGTNEQLTLPIQVDHGGVDEYEISPDGSRVIFRATVDDISRYELYSAPIGGGVTAKLNTALPASGGVNSFAISDNSERVVYVADQQQSFMDEIYSVPLADGAVTKLNAPLAPGTFVYSYFGISPNSNHVFYMATQNGMGVYDIFVAFDEKNEAAVENEMVYLPMIQN